VKLQEKSNTIAAVGTVVAMVLLFLILWFIYLNVPVPEEDEGVMVSFGEVMEEGGGLPTEEVYAPSEPIEAASPTPPQAEPLLTQEDEAAMQAAKIEKERQRAEAERKKAEEKKKQEAVAKADQLGALFGQTSSAEGANGQPGDNGKAVNGNPLGHGTSGGNNWSLDGRSLVGSLPKPNNDFNQEGKVVVFITVNKEGRVVNARAGEGTTISDEATKQSAVKAALQAKFNVVDKPNAVMGTITYYFKFK